MSKTNPADTLFDDSFRVGMAMFLDSKLYRGEFGLLVTYWLFWTLGSTLVLFTWKMIPVENPYRWIALVLGFSYIGYSSISTLNASKLYEGWKVWSTLARIQVWFLLISMGLAVVLMAAIFVIDLVDKGPSPVATKAPALSEGASGLNSPLPQPQVAKSPAAPPQRYVLGTDRFGVTEFSDGSWARPPSMTIEQASEHIVAKYPYLDTPQGEEALNNIISQRDALIQQGRDPVDALLMAGRAIAPLYLAEQVSR